MTGSKLRIAIAAVLFFHGIGHLMGVIPALGIIPVKASSPDWLRGWTSRSWLFTNLIGGTAASILCAVLFALVFVGFIGTGFSLLGWLVPHATWRTLAVTSAVLSLVTVALYWNGLMLFFPHKVGALSVDLSTLVCLLWLNWPSEAAIGF